MKNLAPIAARLCLTATLLLPLVACRGEGSQEALPRLVMIGIDAGSWKLFDPLIEAGELPHLAKLAGRGTTAELGTVEPVISPAVWTSIATGRTPDVHGVETFFADRRAIRVPTVWERLAASGLRVGLYDHLLTWPPRIFERGFVIPGWLRRDPRIAPEEAFLRAGVEPFFYEVLDVGDDDAVVAHLERELALKPRTWNRLADAFEIDAGAVVLYALDVVSHRLYHTEYPEEFASPPAWEPRFDGILPRIAKLIDDAVGEIVAGLGEKDHVVVISDHGIAASPTLERRWGFDAAALLARAGIDPLGDGVRAVNEFVHLKLVVEPGLEADRDALLERLIEHFADVRGPAGETLLEVESIRDPAALDVADVPPWLADLLASESSAHAFLIVEPHDERLAALWPEGEALVAGERVAVAEFCSPHVFSGDHHPIGIFLAAGPAIRQRTERLQLSVLDIAPLLTYLAGQPIAADLRSLNRALIEPEHLRRHPPRRIAVAEAPHLGRDGEEATEGDEEIRKRLRALGYLD